jgi:hypothetical protein
MPDKAETGERLCLDRQCRGRAPADGRGQDSSAEATLESQGA